MGGKSLKARGIVRRAGKAAAGIVVGALAAAVTAVLPAPAYAREAGGWLVTLRADGAFPGGVLLAWQGAGGRWWGAGVEFDRFGARLDHVWIGPQWALGPDTLSRFSVRAGYGLGFSDTPGGSRGLWVGLWAGQQWVRQPFMAQFGTEIRVPTRAWRSPQWITSAAVGLAW